MSLEFHHTGNITITPLFQFSFIAMNELATLGWTSRQPRNSQKEEMNKLRKRITEAVFASGK